MRILPLCSYNNIQSPYVNVKSSGITFCANKSLDTDVVELNNTTPYDRGLSKLNKITKEEYFLLSEVEKTALRNELWTKLMTSRSDILLHQYAVNTIESVFDKQYGKGNYVVISIGRSLSSISKLLEHRIGKDNVKNIPLSSVEGFYHSCADIEDYRGRVNDMVYLEGFNSYKRYLDSIGLDKQTVETSGKNYIIMDYAASGKSLKGAYTILTIDELLGNKKRNITMASMRDLTSMNEDDFNLGIILDQKLHRSSFKQYSFVDTLYSDIDAVYKAADYTKFLDKGAQEIVKLFGFGLMDSEYFENVDSMCKPQKMAIQKSHPKQNAKIWNDTQKQYLVDVREDIQELYKISLRLNKPVNELEFISKKLVQHNEALAKQTKKQCSNLFDQKFQLEYQYYRNLKEFEKLTPNLSEYDYNYFSKIMNQPCKDFGKDFKLYRLFELTEDELENLKTSLSEPFKEFRHIEIDKKILDNLIVSVQKYLSASFQEDYYDKVRPKLLSVVEKFSEIYSIGNVKNLNENLFDFRSGKLYQQINKYTNFLKELEITLSKISVSVDKSDLLRILKEQKEALTFAKKCLIFR